MQAVKEEEIRRKGKEEVVKTGSKQSAEVKEPLNDVKQSFK